MGWGGGRCGAGMEVMCGAGGGRSAPRGPTRGRGWGATQARERGRTPGGLCAVLVSRPQVCSADRVTGLSLASADSDSRSGFRSEGPFPQGNRAASQRRQRGLLGPDADRTFTRGPLTPPHPATGCRGPGRPRGPPSQKP